MISIAGVALPKTAYWANETSFGQPKAEYTEDMNGVQVSASVGISTDIDIYIPEAPPALSRDDVMTLIALSDSQSEVTLIINERSFQAVFRHSERVFELFPLRAVQNPAQDSGYFGTIRLKEI